jgi:citrate synthase
LPEASRRYLTSTEAATLLGVSRSSLYAYVSRGRIHAEADPRNPRASRYRSADVERLRDRKEARLHPDVAARKTLAWGTPVLESSLTSIVDGRLFYRGEDAVALARRARFEDAVRLLWHPSVPLESSPARISSTCGRALAQMQALTPIERMQAILPLAASEDPTAFDTSERATGAAGWRILTLLTAAATMKTECSSGPIAGRLADGWNVQGRGDIRLLDRALILCADHELNVSAFAARVVASTGSSPYDVVGAGLAALRGPRHGGHTARVEHLLDEARHPRGLRGVLADYVRRGERPPGFGHPLYPDGDPRARALFAAVEEQWPSSPAAGFVRAATSGGRAIVGDAPTVDFALVILRRALALPSGSALVLFALGRTAGWIAHAMEQYATGRLIRPRAAYTGAAPR